MLSRRWVFILISCYMLFACVAGSVGDRSQFYNQCVLKCRKDSCIDDDKFKIPPSISLSLLSWTCVEDCKYSCMWKTVEYFLNHGLSIPQFHGKWPFTRIFGCQEPASVLFSIFNLYAHVVMYQKFKKKVKSTCPMSYVWTYFSIICLNGWFWSTIFHARDRQFTEVMDYSCAFAMVLTLLYCTLLRITYKNIKVFIVLTCGYISILYTHLLYLWSGTINYGYNMKYNIVLGVLNFVITMVWWYYTKRKLPHIYLIGWFNILTVLVTLLEVTDFPPIFWTFDAHSLWHAATAPLTILLYRFMIQDCLHLNMEYNKLLVNFHHIQ